MGLFALHLHKHRQFAALSLTGVQCIGIIIKNFLRFLAKSPGTPKSCCRFSDNPFKDLLALIYDLQLFLHRISIRRFMVKTVMGDFVSIVQNTFHQRNISFHINCRNKKGGFHTIFFQQIHNAIHASFRSILSHRRSLNKLHTIFHIFDLIKPDQIGVHIKAQAKSTFFSLRPNIFCHIHHQTFPDHLKIRGSFSFLMDH